MKKPFKHTEVSEDRHCEDCHRPLKKNLLHKIPKAPLCYKCFYPKEMARRGVSII